MGVELYQIGFECQVATEYIPSMPVEGLYQIGFECQVATKRNSEICSF